MNAKDGFSSNLESSSEEKKDKKENIENEDENPGEEVVTKTDATDCDIKSLREEPDCLKNKQCESSLELPLEPTLHERFLRIKQTVKDAIAAHHTFTIYGKSRVIRDCMLKRGWCEKIYRKNNGGDQHFNVDSSPVLLLAGIGDLKDQQSERLLISRMLANHTVDFLWNTGSDWPGWPAQDNKTTVFNRYCRAGFTSKVGLCSSVKQMHWYYEAGVANTLFPRCYNICQSDQMHAFVEDFRLTGCLSLLKWLVDKVNAEDEDVVRSPTGTVPLKALDFAIKRCSDYVSAQSHEDIDQEGEKVWSHQWDQFISWYYQIVRDQALFVRTNVPFNKYILASKHVLKKMKKYWPQIDMDGVMNMWILKPGNKSRGRGIVLMNKLEDVVAKVNPTGKPDTRYVVQKYIERPLLIHHTKFDIRQWFIVTCAQPLTLWMYKESYLRFCSQKFSLDDFHESIHLCNNAIQCKYNNCDDRDSALPADNMWDATTFKEFLRSQGHADAWNEQIYPGMKQSLVGSLLASQEAMDRRKNSFELYGADFMVMEDFSVWLIEINSHPDMSYSTSVTTRLCRQVMEDTIKVVVDFREDKNADTGDFELAYKQRMPSCQPYLGAALSLQGTRITIGEKKSSLHQDFKSNLVAKSPMTKKKSMVHSNIGPVIVDLIEELEIQFDQEFYSYCNSNSPKSRLVLPATAPTKPLKVISDEKVETMTKSTSAGTTSINKTKSPTPAKTNVQNHSKSSNNEKRSSHKPPRKLRMHTNTTGSKLNTFPRQTLISKIMALQEQSTNEAPKSEKSLRKNEDKSIKIAIQDAVKKYKRNVTIQPEVSPLPSLLTPPIVKVTPVSTAKSKSRSFLKKQTHHRKNKMLTDISDMYAVGLNGLQQLEKLLRIPADFIWHTNKKPTMRVDDKTIVNKFTGSYFTSKIDMCNNLEKAYWFYEAGVSDIKFPRCYNFYQSAQMEEFIQDYYITACFGILKWFTLLANLVGPKNTWSPNGTIPINVISFALERCEAYISIQIHEDIDHTDCEYTPPSAWDQFLDWHHNILYKRGVLKETDEIDINELMASVHDVMKTMIKYRPQSIIDGIRNIWILKPGDDSLGRGIVLKHSLVDIIAKVNRAAKENIEYVVQKYIERPLLVHRTKIDIRQWFLITRTQPLVVWMFKDILIRFASKDFTLSDFHESIHLCNTTVQLKYRQLPTCNSDLPKQRHWNLQDFKNYLQSRGQKLAWEKIIRPGIKQNLIGALLASQDNMVNRKNSFQLYGADFVVADDFSVWLLEINTNPRLNPPSSKVTAQLYPEVIEDAMKIILDRRKNKKASHGKFECIYKQHNPFCGVNILGQGVSLGIRGKSLFVTPKSST
ncbi:PREDICTED: tubulin monoglycylase TTLL3-like [Trachymyrmex septentrionalis]|uniref:tubulin monoglycylase TTLL3-like n=1 Tax=Trachymyrmex septentrionalis TaxID=34720 RepID=UPI00084F2AE1|nr:PREDICTED: tubulin monoglycylase TTLL3-like [Trachymyrmex septentrionalis]